MFAFSYGAAFGAIQHMPRIVPGLAEVASLAAAGAAADRRPACSGGRKSAASPAASLLALLVLAIVSRRSLLRVFQVPGLIVVPLVFWFAPSTEVSTLKIGMFLAGFFTVAQFSFWGNYLPRVYPTHLRGTGEGFAANVGGRMLGTSFAYVTTTLASEPVRRAACGAGDGRGNRRVARLQRRRDRQLRFAGAEERALTGVGSGVPRPFRVPGSFRVPGLFGFGTRSAEADFRKR